jgi:hypothetical protein
MQRGRLTFLQDFFRYVSPEIRDPIKAVTLKYFSSVADSRQRNSQLTALLCSGVVRFSGARGRVMTTATPNRNYELLKKNHNYVLNFFGSMI